MAHSGVGRCGYPSRLSLTVLPRSLRRAALSVGGSSHLPINSHAIYAVNLPDLEPHWSSDHLLATLPASLLSMRQGLWRLSSGCVLAWPQAGRKAVPHCESATSRIRRSQEGATSRPSRRS